MILSPVVLVIAVFVLVAGIIGAALSRGISEKA